MQEKDLLFNVAKIPGRNILKIHWHTPLMPYIIQRGKAWAKNGGSARKVDRESIANLLQNVHGGPKDLCLSVVGMQLNRDPASLNPVYC